jgi:hypothetical protein
MAKQTHQKRKKTKKEGIIVEQHSTFDDSLLPTAEQ